MCSNADGGLLCCVKLWIADVANAVPATSVRFRHVYHQWVPSRIWSDALWENINHIDARPLLPSDRRRRRSMIVEQEGRCNFSRGCWFSAFVALWTNQTKSEVPTESNNIRQYFGLQQQQQQRKTKMYIRCCCVWMYCCLPCAPSIC